VQGTMFCRVTVGVPLSVATLEELIDILTEMKDFMTNSGVIAKMAAEEI
jgi:hypothetical protein